jgi:Methane oxygenase PmoA
MISVTSRHSGPIACSWDGVELFRYVWQPTEPDLESPRPYLHPVRTLAGDEVSLYRPPDHVWHKGISWALCEVGGMNFWGGPTYRRDRGYVQLDNNGQMRHDRFIDVGVRDGALHIDEDLTWTTGQGEVWIAEQRHIAATVHPDSAAWRLSFGTRMRNVSGGVIPIGSPSTQGRDNAGYSGLFWRGPRSFSGGTVITEKGPAGEELMGSRAPWLGYVGRHDGHHAASTLIFADSPANFCFPCEWFVRTSIFACVCPAPFFSTEYHLAHGESLTLGFDVIVANGERDADGCAALVAQILRPGDHGPLIVEQEGRQ